MKSKILPITAVDAAIVTKSARMIPENRTKNSIGARETRGGVIIRPDDARYPLWRTMMGRCGGALCSAAWLACVVAGAGTAQAQDVPGGDGPTSDAAGAATLSDPNIYRPVLPRRLAWPLKVVSWNLQTASKAGAIDIIPAPEHVWRHTFGAERRSPSRANFDIATLDADVVLLQGMRLISHVRLLFPARGWRVIVSRQSLRPVHAPAGAPPGWGNMKRTLTTAIAVRYRRGVRIAGQDHILETSVRHPVSDGEPPETAAAVAVRLRVEGQTIWVVSADLTEACGSTDGNGGGVDDCDARRMLMGWAGARQPGERVILGGHDVLFPAQHSKSTGDCPHQLATEVLSSKATQLPVALSPTNSSSSADSASASGQRMSTAYAQPREGAGCLAALMVAADGAAPR
ncbi:MAG: hypothetical protein KDJ47_02305 [Hyphomicrobiaceae bacterium]|nr:hypothetical protein [Hyphomicrobiaceae bacterium]